MRNILLYNYNIDISEYEKIQDKGISFYVDYTKYYFVKTYRTKEDLKIIYELLSSNQSHFHKIILNKNGEIQVEEDNNLYVLLKVNGAENGLIDLEDILKNEIVVNEKTILNRDNWNTLWSEKVDYLEYQMSELGKGHPIAIKSFSYYVGLAENAIEYFNMLKIDNVPLTISRKRIYYPSIYSNFYNPLNIIVDWRVRDLAEYIKSEFFASKKDNIDTCIYTLMKKNFFSPLEYNLLYVRLLFPSYYFDDLTEVLEHNKSDDTLLKYIEKTEEYEKFLNYVYKTFSKVCSMIKINWLNEKKS